MLCQEDIVVPQGGTGTYVRNISFALSSLGNEIHVISRHYPGMQYEEKCGDIFIHRVKAPGLPVLYNVLYFFQTKRIFNHLNQSIKFDIVHGNTPLMSSFGLVKKFPIVETAHATVREQLRVLKGKKITSLNLNENLVRLLAPIWLILESYLLKRADRVIAVSQGLKNELLADRLCAENKIVVIPNGVDQTLFTEEAQPQFADNIRHSLGIPDEAKIVLYLGRLTEGKRVLDLVEALPIIREHCDAWLVIVGQRTAYASKLEALAKALKVTPFIRLTDHVPYQDVGLYYKLADVYALPSESEAFPFTILEAMASGTPIVASNIAGINEQIRDGENGFLHPVGDITAIATKIIELLENEQVALSFAVKARQIVNEEYNWSMLGRKTEQIYRLLIR